MFKMTDRELLQQALEWVEWFASDDHSVRPTKRAGEIAEAIKARLAQCDAGEICLGCRVCPDAQPKPTQLYRPFGLAEEARLKEKNSDR